MPKKTQADGSKLDQIVAEARRNREQRERGYRDQALKLYPWICTRCGREFTHATLYELTVHHKDHNHDRNPPDGSNWELLCLYCHDNEHSRYADAVTGSMATDGVATSSATYKPFADLKSLLRSKE